MTLEIVPNINTTWYDPARVSGDPIITQNVNYVGGANTLKSTSKTTYRLMQDSLKRLIPTCLRQGMGVSVSVQDIDVAVGDAVINGRWVMNTTTESFDASVLGDGTYYLSLEVTEDTEDVNRDPQAESVALVATLTGSFTTASNKLVLCKFTVSSGTPTITEDYTTVPATWAAASIVPPVSPDGSTYGSVEIYSGVTERVKQAVVEADGLRATKRIIVDDTDGTPVGKVHIRNRDQEMEARNAPSVDNDYVPFHAKSLKINGSELLDLNKRLKNAEILDNVPFVDSGDVTKKLILDASGITGGVTRTITMIDEDLTIVGRTNVQTLTQKTLTTPTIADFSNANHDHADAAGGGGGIPQSSITDLEQFNAIGASNQLWITASLAFAVQDTVGSYPLDNDSVSNLGVRWAVAENGQLFYTIPLPAQIGSYKLYVSGIRLAHKFDSDANNRISFVSFRAARDGDISINPYSADPGWGSVLANDLVTHTFTPVNFEESSVMGKGIGFYLSVLSDTTFNLSIGHPEIRYHYA